MTAFYPEGLALSGEPCSSIRPEVPVWGSAPPSSAELCIFAFLEDLACEAHQQPATVPREDSFPV